MTSTEKAGRTPGAWTSSIDNGGKFFVHSKFAPTQAVGMLFSEADAAFIVFMENHFDEMREALEKIAFCDSGWEGELAGKFILIARDALSKISEKAQP